MILKKSVLIIDDDTRNIFALRLALKARGYVAVSALSATEGLHMLADRDDIRVVLMDMMMPEMDGYEALRVIASNPALYNDTPVVSVTAQAMSGDREKCLEAGAKGYVSKPVDIDKLIAVIEKVS